MLPEWFELRSASMMAATSAFFMALVLASQAGIGRHIPGFAPWLAMAIITPAGLALNNLQGFIPDWLAFPLGLGLLNAGVWCVWVGARQFMGRASYPWTIPVVGLATAASAWYFSAIAPSVTGRVLIVSPLHAWVTAATAWLLWRRHDEDLRFALRFVSLPMAVFAVISAARAAAALFGPPMTAGFVRTPANTLAYLVGSAAMLCTYMGLVICINALAAREVRREADHDALTGLLNRHGLKRRFAAWQTAHPAGAALLVDIDHFKRVNDALGHAEGDRLLSTMAATLMGLAESTALVCRLGGDEFVLLVESRAAAVPLAQAASRDFEDHCRISYDSIGEPAPSLSIGLGAVTADLSSTLKAADIALYAAKSQGRRRIVDATES